MADQHSGDNNKDDGTTTPPSENLKQTRISDKEPVKEDTLDATTAGVVTQEPKSPDAAGTKTPELAGSSEPGDSEMKELIASPKKKRGREVDDDVREIEGENKVEEAVAANGTAAANGGRTVRSAPEKKRPRDTSEDPSKLEDSPPEKKASSSSETADEKIESSKSDTSDTASTKLSQPIFGSSSSDKPASSSSAFAASGFGALASKPSGFASLGANKSSVFGGTSTSTPPGSVFGGALGAKSLTSTEPAAPLSGFGGLAAQKPGGALGSAFGTTASSFGSIGGGFGGGFGSGFAAPVGQKLSSFASAAKPDIVGADKPAKAFGAPDSDADDGSDDDDSDGGAGSDDEEGASVTGEEKKKQKLGKIPRNDGEEAEATLLQFRAKLFAIESKEKGWKERGVGTLKLNVPKSYVDYDHNGIPIPGSYDPSGAEDREEDEEGNPLPEPVAARLVMRQENTHRVILNTVIIKALKFEEKPSNTAVQILFTAFEETKPINMLLKMSETNARLFTSEISTIQHEL